MLKLNIVVVAAMLTLAVALVACGQGVEPTPEPTPTLIPMMSVDEVSRIVGECTGLVHNDLAKIDVEKLNSLSEAVGLQPVQPTAEGFDEHLVVLGYAAMSVHVIETRRWIQEHCLEHIENMG